MERLFAGAHQWERRAAHHGNIRAAHDLEQAKRVRHFFVAPLVAADHRDAQHLNLRDWISSASVCMLLPPGPEQSSLIIILRRGWLHAREPASSSAIASRVIRSSLTATSESQLQSELNQTRIVHRVVDHGKRAEN